MNTDKQLDPNRFRSTAAAGLRTVPLKPKAKEPALPWKQFQDRAPTEAELASWDSSNFNVGIVCGAPSGVVVLDVDSSEAQKLVDGLDLPPTPTVSTGRGVHYYFERPSFEVRNDVGIAGVKLDVRGDGGYVVAPGSVHPSGARYEWIVSPEDIPFAPFPESLRNLLGGTKVRPNARNAGGSAAMTGSASRFEPYLTEHLHKAESELAKKVEGERNKSLFLLAVRLASDVVAAGDGWTRYAEELTPIALDIGLEAGAIAATLESAWRNASQTPTQWIRLAQDWIYVSGADRYRHLGTGMELTPQAFRTEFGSINPDPELSITTFLTRHDFIEKVQSITFNPAQPTGIYEENGRKWFNVYRSSSVVAVEGDATPFEQFVEYLIPEEFERNQLLKFMAHLVQKPGEKLAHAVILGSKEHGVGKSTLLHILFEILGPHNCRKASSEELESQYNAYVQNSLLVLVEEINLGAGGRRVYNKLKDLITGPTVPMRRMYQDWENVPNMANFVFLTNLDRPILLDKEDRRYLVLNSPAKPRDAGYYTEFNEWWRNNLGVIRHFLEQVDLSSFEPFAPPPMTQAKAELIKGSETPVIQELREMLDERAPPFHVDVVTYQQVAEAVQRRLPKTSRNSIEDALREIEAVKLGQHRLPKTKSMVFRFQGQPQRPSLWAVRNQSFWQEAASKECVEEYLAETGRLADLPELPAGFAYHPGEVFTPYPRDNIGDADARLLKLIRALNARECEEEPAE